MPGFDKTGPEGQGPMTGRGLGKCNPDNKNFDENQDDIRFGRGIGRGLRWGWGRGRGMGMGRGWRGGPGRGQGRRFRGGNQQD